MNNSLSISPKTARHLALRAQRLDQIPQKSNKDAMYAVIRQIGCLQIDPINVVARSPLLVLFSRLGAYQTADLEALMWDDRLLFEYWAHAASIVLVEDFPLFQLQMRNFSRGNGAWARRVRQWLEVNEPFRRYIMAEMADRGPLYAKEIEDRSVQPWQSSGWTNARNVSTMLGLMWEQGDITVTRREGAGFGLKKQWGLFELHMPQWVGFEPKPQAVIVREAAQKSLRALGVANAKHIQNYFIRGGYPNLDQVLEELLREKQILPITIRDNGTEWPGDWYIHSTMMPEFERLQKQPLSTQTVLLSPFDNLIADRDRTELLFDFHYRSEIYTPKAKRKFGYYVMPILHNGRLIGRVDPKLDRKKKILHVYAVHAEEDVPENKQTGQAVAGAVRQLGRFLGAREIHYGDTLPATWSGAFENEDI